jgi:hypothetical protein
LLPKNHNPIYSLYLRERVRVREDVAMLSAFLLKKEFLCVKTHILGTREPVPVPRILTPVSL